MTTREQLTKDAERQTKEICDRLEEKYKGSEPLLGKEYTLAPGTREQIDRLVRGDHLEAYRKK